MLQNPKGKSNRVAKLLDHIMMKRPDEDFVKLKEALTELGQVHVVKYLEPSAVDNTDRAQRSASESAAEVDLSRFCFHGWKNLLVNKRTKLVDCITVNDELITELIKLGVINVTFSEILKVIIFDAFLRCIMISDAMTVKS